MFLRRSTVFLASASPTSNSSTTTAEQQKKQVEEAAQRANMNADGLPENWPTYKEAAARAWDQAKEAGAGKFKPGGLDDGEKGGGEEQQTPQQEPVPPPVRSVLSLGANTTMWFSQTFKASPGIQGGLFYQNKSFCYSAGWRDGHRGMDPDDKGNFLRLRDPLGLHKVSVVFFGHLVWKLHKEGHIDMFAPLCTILPELESNRCFDSLFPRDILSYQVGMDDRTILNSLGITGYPQHGRPNVNRYHAQITAPLNALFSPDGTDPMPSRPEGSENLPPKNPESLSKANEEYERNPERVGMHMRRKLVSKMVELASEDKRKLGPMVKLQNRALESHFAIALLAAAIEKKMDNTSVEELFRKKVTEPLGIMSVSYGIPAIVYRSSIFWQPVGLPCAHLSTTQDNVRPGDCRHSASPLFNPSMNLFGNGEDVAKLLLACLKSAKQSVEELPSSAMTGQNYYELGWQYVPHKKRFCVKQNWFSKKKRNPIEGTPYSASVIYNDGKDAGSFAVTNCGNNRALWTTNFASQFISQLFIKQCLDTGMELDATDEHGQVIPEGAEVKADEGKLAWGGEEQHKQKISTPSSTSNSSSNNSNKVPQPKKKEFKSEADKKLYETLHQGKNKSMSEAEQIEFMREQAEEHKKASDEITNSLLHRASKFFKSGQVNKDGFKRF